MAASSAPLSLLFNPKSPLHLCAPQNSLSPRTFQSTQSSRRIPYYLNLPTAVRPKPPKSFKLAAINGNFSLSEAIPVEASQEIVSTTDDGVATVISVLLFIAFVGLSILTIGVVYIAVTDFLQKRERDKFEKEESAKKKKGGKKGRVRARAGPKGFGQKNQEYDDYLDEAD
ncbi:hypothetical protein ACP275_04G089100 [Erythranthe tilingii]